MQLSFLTIGTRLGLAFGLLVLMMLGASAVGVLRLGEVGVINERIIDDSWVKSEAASLIDATTRANARLTMELVITTDLQRLQAIKGNIAVNKKSIDDAFAVLQQKVQLPEGKATLARLSELRGKYVQSFGRVAALVDAGDRDTATALLQSETLPALDALQEPINALTALQKKTGRKRWPRCSQQRPQRAHADAGAGRARPAGGCGFVLWHYPLNHCATGPGGEIGAHRRRW